MKKRISFISLLYALFLLLNLVVSGAMASQRPDDHDALSGMSQPGKAFFDINIGVTPETFDASMGKLALYLDVIRQTHESLLLQSVIPEMVVVFRGPAVTLVADKASDEVKALIGELAKRKVRFEACSVATTLMGTARSSILPEVKVVGNTFISAIGYQASGYGYILIQ